MNSKNESIRRNLSVNTSPFSNISNGNNNNMNNMNVAPAPVPGTLELPPWIFDVYDEDHIIIDELDVSTNSTFPTSNTNINTNSNSTEIKRSLLDELGIDLRPSLLMIYFVLKLPYLLLIEKFNISKITSLFPLKYDNLSEIHGPLMIISILAGIQWLGLSHRDATWMYIIWICASFFSHLVGRVCLHRSSMIIHMCILGYSVVPVIPLSLFHIFVKPSPSAAIIIDLHVIAWCGAAAHIMHKYLSNIVITPSNSNSNIYSSNMVYSNSNDSINNSTSMSSTDNLNQTATTTTTTSTTTTCNRRLNKGLIRQGSKHYSSLQLLPPALLFMFYLISLI